MDETGFELFKAVLPSEAQVVYVYGSGSKDYPTAPKLRRAGYGVFDINIQADPEQWPEGLPMADWGFCMITPRLIRPDFLDDVLYELRCTCSNLFLGVYQSAAKWWAEQLKTWWPVFKVLQEDDHWSYFVCQRGS